MTELEQAISQKLKGGGEIIELDRRVIMLVLVTLREQRTLIERYTAKHGRLYDGPVVEVKIGHLLES